MAAMARLKLSDPVHSSYFNPWLIWKFGERFKVGFVWEFVAGERHTWEMRTAWPGNPGILEAYLDRYGVLTLILHTAELPVVEHFRRLG